MFRLVFFALVALVVSLAVLYNTSDNINQWLHSVEAYQWIIGSILVPLSVGSFVMYHILKVAGRPRITKLEVSNLDLVLTTNEGGVTANAGEAFMSLIAHVRAEVYTSGNATLEIRGVLNRTPHMKCIWAVIKLDSISRVINGATLIDEDVRLIDMTSRQLANESQWWPSISLYVPTANTRTFRSWKRVKAHVANA